MGTVPAGDLLAPSIRPEQRLDHIDERDAPLRTGRAEGDRETLQATILPGIVHGSGTHDEDRQPQRGGATDDRVSCRQRVTTPTEVSPLTPRL